MLTTDYGDATDFENRQREQTFRGVVSWDHIKSNWKVGVKGGYIHTWMAYDYKREVAPDNWASMTRSRSKVNTFLCGGCSLYLIAEPVLPDSAFQGISSSNSHVRADPLSRAVCGSGKQVCS